MFGKGTDIFLSDVTEYRYRGGDYLLYCFEHRSDQYKEWYIQSKNYGIIMLVYGVSYKHEDYTLSIESLIDATEEYKEKYEDKD